VPFVSGDKAFLAHWAETLDYYGKQRMVTRFFDASDSDADRAAVLSRFDVRYVFYSDQERALGGFDPAGSSLFCRVYANSTASIFRVTRGVGDSCQ
jgi:uncharacterized membrane protein